MKTEKIVAKVKGKEVASKEIHVAETLEEAIHICGGDKVKVVGLFNIALKTSTRNSLAAAHRPKAANKSMLANFETFERALKLGVSRKDALAISSLTEDMVKAIQEVQKTKKSA